MSIILTGMVLGASLAMAGTASAAPVEQDVDGAIQQTNNSTTSGADSTVISIDGETRVTDYRFENGTAFVTIEADRPVAVTVTQAIREPSRKSMTVPVETFALKEGEETIQLSLRSGTDMDEAAITLSTQDSVEAGQIVALFSSTSTGGGERIRDLRAWGTGAAVAVAAGAVAWRRKRSKSQDEPIAEWGDD